MMNLADWLSDVSGSDFVWYFKRLSGNDTLANESHQAGPYIPRDFLLSIFPSMNNRERKNPDRYFDLYIASHDDRKKVRAIWYNNKLFGGTRDETRITRFGGRSSALLDPDNTGALALFAFRLDHDGEALDCAVWICRDPDEEDYLEDKTGPVEPGRHGTLWMDDTRETTDTRKADPSLHQTSCWLTRNQLPARWLVKYPSGQEIISKSIEMRPVAGLDPDSRLLERRECEFFLFQSLEEAVELPVISQGFESIEDFLKRAQTIIQRRKSRSGRSLELHARAIFMEEGMEEDRDFVHQPVSEGNKRPDFLFPGGGAYHDASFSAGALRMLAVKTTCKDRWRQILNEANRIETKHLLTLQEGISENQFREMTAENVRLVVPAGLHRKYHKDLRPELLSFSDFIRETRGLSRT